MLSFTIDAEEQIDVVTADNPCAFMQADMMGNLNVKLEGSIAELLSKINPKAYDNFIHLLCM